MTRGWRAFLTAGAVAAPVVLAIGGGGSLAAAGAAGSGTITDISQACSGQNAEVEQAVDPARGYVYEEWMGCHNSIGFSRSTDGGRHFGRPVVLPGSAGGWDPALAVAPGGTVYAAFMNSTKHHSFPVVEASFDHGQSFPQVRQLVPHQDGNWGDRDFIAVSPAGTVYVTWDYGPSAKKVTFICSPTGSCAFASGDLNAVIQISRDGGKTWSGIIPVSPGFPASGGDSAPMVIEPNGRIDVEYQGYRVTNPKTYALAPAHSYFTSSSDGGHTWTAPVRIGPARLTMSKAEWWIDGALARDAAGNLYATWDSQGHHRDIGWLSFSTDGGRTWSPLRRVTPDQDHSVHIVEPAGGLPGRAYVGWLADNSPHGYAEYVRVFSIARGWLSPPVQVSQQFGHRNVWPGDTFGISSFLPGQGGSTGPARVMLSWGSATTLPNSEIFATVVSGLPPASG